MGSSQRKSISFVSNSPQVVLTFGSTKQKIMFHRDLLLPFEYFAACINNVKSEGDFIEIDMSTFSTAAGNLLAHWVYFAKLPIRWVEAAQLQGQDAMDASTGIVEAYSMAIYLKLERFANKLSDVYMRFQPDELPLTRHYDALNFYHCDHGNRLSVMVLTMLAMQIHEHDWEHYMTSLNPTLKDRLEKGGRFVVDLMKHVVEDKAKSMKEMRRRNGCVFHVHQTSKPCSEEVETPKRERSEE